MQTADGAWRVEVVRGGDTYWFRVVHAQNMIDWLDVANVERLLDQAGVDISQLNEVISPSAEGRLERHG